MEKLPHTHSCFVCGEANPVGLKLRFETDGKIVRALFTPRAEHIGFKTVVHGGILSTLLDEIMVWACAVSTKRFAFCVELNVRFLHPAVPGQALTATGELTGNRRNKLFEARGELRNPAGEVISTATGKYLAIKETERSGILGELIGNFPGDWAISG